jgi:ferredoxin
LPVGSSASTARGSPTTARAIATRCRSPPDSSCGRCVSRCPRPTRSSAAAARRAARAADAGVQQAVGHVVHAPVPGREVELLEDEPDVRRPQRRQLPVGQRATSYPAIRTVPATGRSSVR